MTTLSGSRHVQEAKKGECYITASVPKAYDFMGDILWISIVLKAPMTAISLLDF